MTDEQQSHYEYLKQRYESYVHERDGLKSSSLAVSERYMTKPFCSWPAAAWRYR